MSNPELRKAWEMAAPGWAKWEEAFTAGLEGATDMLLDMAGVRTDMRVLDVACGSGGQPLKVAEWVGQNGRVVASDISAIMLENVRRKAAEAGLQNIDTLECAADELDETQSSFDAAICRLGLMLFPAPRRALEAVRSILKPGARFAALVFTTPANNPFMAQPMAVLLRHANKSPPAAGMPGIFALGKSARLENLMMDSGLVDVRKKIVRASLQLPSASAALEMMQQGFAAYRAVVTELNENEKLKAWSDVHECLKQFESEDGFKTELEFIIGSGAKPSA